MADRVSSVIRVLQKAGFRGPELKTAFGIVMRESGGNPQAHNTNRKTGDDSYGLAQINMLGSMGPARRRQFGIQSDAQLLDPATNARAMFQMSRGGKDFGAWGIGPNAYRAGAGMDTIRPFLSRFPSGGAAPAAPAPARAQAPAAGPDRLGLAFALINASRERRGADPLAVAFASQSAAPKPVTSPEPPRKLQSSMGVLDLPSRWTGTHVTDNLGWGTKTAQDIMAKPGTPVGAPEDGTIRYFHPEGAQGGGSMELVTDDGTVYWLGHIAKGLPAGTRVKRDQPVAVVANQTVSAPHVHEDKRTVAA